MLEMLLMSGLAKSSLETPLLAAIRQAAGKTHTRGERFARSSRKFSGGKHRRQNA
jgi:hypothetical protein